MIYTINNTAVVNEIVSESIINGYSILIPRAYAREESDVKVRKVDEISKIDHYKIYISRQIGSIQTRKDTYVYVKLPESGNYIPIILHVDGGVSFHPVNRKYALREFDDLDRRIILGYCRKFHSTLTKECHDDSKKSKFYLQTEASYYRASHQPKRFKLGSEGNNFSRFYKSLEPYEESHTEGFSNYFDKIVFI